jgi:glycosyltransferase involved in cell wall biosynthesis
MNNKKIKISACIVVYEEEKNMDGLLTNLSNFVDEVIIVYDGENVEDKTIELALNYGKKLNLVVKTFLRPHTGNPESHRPFSFKQAIGDWILYIDADERIDGDINGVKDFIYSHENVSRIRFFLGTKKELDRGVFKHRRPSLFKRNDFFYIGVFGWKPTVFRGESFDYPETIKIIHLETGQSLKKLIKKSFYYSWMNFQDHIKPIEEIEFFNVNENIKNCFEKKRKQRKILAPFLMIASSFRNMLIYLSNKRPLKNVLTAGLQTFLFYLFLSFRFLLPKTKKYVKKN